MKYSNCVRWRIKNDLSSRKLFDYNTKKVIFPIDDNIKVTSSMNLKNNLFFIRYYEESDKTGHRYHSYCNLVDKKGNLWYKGPKKFTNIFDINEDYIITINNPDNSRSIFYVNPCKLLLDEVDGKTISDVRFLYNDRIQVINKDGHVSYFRLNGDTITKINDKNEIQ